MTLNPAALPPFGPTLGYAFGDVDRLSARRDDDVAMEAFRHAPDSVTVVLAGEQVLLQADGRPWFALPEAAGFAPVRYTALLGLRAGVALFGTSLAAELPAGVVADGSRKLKDLRAIAVEASLPPADIGALAQAKALFHWHGSHGFCATCGIPTEAESAGWRRRCPSCAALHFPRTDPVVIMMATNGERCLLGRQPRFPAGMYSCLAGFVEPGETIEDAVRRELHEESGIATGRVSYLGSQPWPFPASVMIGCLAEATSSAIAIDPDELEDARWFSRDETRALIEGRHPAGLVCPPVMAIANHLMRAWAYGG